MLGSRIASLRRMAGLSQIDLAKHLSISPSAVGMYEQGRRIPSIGILYSLSQVFDISMDYLITGIPYSPQDIIHYTELFEMNICDILLESRPNKQSQG